MSRISLLVVALSLSGVALADGQLEGVVFESGTGAPWPNAVLHLETDAGERVEVPLSSDASLPGLQSPHASAAVAAQQTAGPAPGGSWWNPSHTSQARDTQQARNWKGPRSHAVAVSL